METPDHIKLAYCRYLTRKGEEMEKAALTVPGLGAGVRTFGKALGNRVMGSAKAIPRDLMLPFQMFSKDKGKFMRSMKANDMMHAGGGSIMRPAATNMGASGRRFDQFAQMDDTTFNSVMSKTPSMVGGMRNPFQNRDTYWLTGLDDAGKAALAQGRKAVASGGRLERERINFLRNTVGKEMDPRTFRQNYKQYGKPGEGGWGAQEAGRRAGAVVGGLGVYGAGVQAPVTLAEWAGGASAIPGASGRAEEGAMAGAADQLQQFRNGSFMDRMGNAWNPNAMLENLYSPENINRSGVAHHYMYGPGQQEQIQGPGFGGYARELLFPMIPGIGNFGSLGQSVESNALNQFQKMGFEKSALGLLGPAKAVAKPAIGAATKAIRKIPAGSMGHAPLPLPKATSEATKAVGKSTEGLWGGVKQRFGNAKSIINEHPMYALGAGMAVPFTAGSFFGGRQTVRDGAYNAGYGAGSAGAAQQFANMNMFQRFGAAAFPDMAMNKLFEQYPQLMEAYQQASKRQLPAGMR